MWQHWVNALLGLIVIGVAMFAGLGATFAWTLGVAGAAVILFALWGIADSPEAAGVRHA